MALNIGIISE